jgi:hypothetical protein
MPNMETAANDSPTTPTELKLLGRDEILNNEDLVYEIVPVPEWGGAVRVRSLRATERDAFEGSLVKGSGKTQRIDTQNIRAKLAAKTIVDAQDKNLFTEKDIVLLGQKSAAALDRVYDTAMRLSKMSKEDMEEEVGNSEPGTSDEPLSS